MLCPVFGRTNSPWDGTGRDQAQVPSRAHHHLYGCPSTVPPSEELNRGLAENIIFYSLH
jgi:hypothetical protein